MPVTAAPLLEGTFHMRILQGSWHRFYFIELIGRDKSTKPAPRKYQSLLSIIYATGIEPLSPFPSLMQPPVPAFALVIYAPYT
jgi:hypothetical protein